MITEDFITGMQVEALEGDRITISDLAECETAACIIQDLEKRIAELEKDQRRLEWLAENEYAPSFKGFIFFDVSCPFSHADTWREAIDAAMEAEQC